MGIFSDNFKPGPSLLLPVCIFSLFIWRHLDINTNIIVVTFYTQEIIFYYDQKLKAKNHCLNILERRKVTLEHLLSNLDGRFDYVLIFIFESNYGYSKEIKLPSIKIKISFQLITRVVSIACVFHFFLKFTKRSETAL